MADRARQRSDLRNRHRILSGQWSGCQPGWVGLLMSSEGSYVWVFRHVRAWYHKLKVCSLGRQVRGLGQWAVDAFSAGKSTMADLSDTSSDYPSAGYQSEAESLFRRFLERDVDNSDGPHPFDDDNLVSSPGPPGRGPESKPWRPGWPVPRRQPFVGNRAGSRASELPTK